MDHAAYITDLVTKLISSYGIFGVMLVLFLIIVVGIIALFYGGYLTFNFVI